MRTKDQYDVELNAAVDGLASTLKTAAAQLSAQFNLPEQEIISDLLEGVKNADLIAYSDGRYAWFRCRARLFDRAKPDDAVADSDPNSEPDAPGKHVERGLQNIVAWGVALARAYHGTPCTGLGRKQSTPIQNARNMLSRRGDGTAVISIDYTTTRRIPGGRGTAIVYMQLRIDIQRYGAVTEN